MSCYGAFHVKGSQFFADSDTSNCCYSLMYGAGILHDEFCCEKYQETIGAGKAGGAFVTLTCMRFYLDSLCVIESRKKAAEKERAEKEKAEAEEKARKERAEAEEKARYDKLIADFNRQIQVNPNDAEAYRLRGGMYAQIKKFREAIADFNEAKRIEPTNAESYAMCGYAYSENKKYNKALTNFNEAIRLDSNCKNAYLWRGGMHGCKGEFDKAIADCEEALQIAPNDSDAKNLLKIARKGREEQHIEGVRWNKQVLLAVLVPAVIFAVIFAIIIGGVSESSKQPEVRQNPPTVVSVTTATVTAKSLNLRSAPASNAKVVKKLKKGDKLTVIGSISGQWIQVKYESKQGYVDKKYVSIKQK
ncbi:tetratricopeptide repeat-containing protein [Candidatus Symbiothrix dinenymphae]|nr:tetratricopeptide repeat-containing protein [Candidatus Symbiothrix dinenymphae]